MSIPPPSGPQQPQQPQDPYRAPQASYPPPVGAPYGMPYRPWGQGYTPFSRQAPVNGVAIAALVLGVMCFLPAVGLVLGIIALAQIRKRGERGRPMAVVGAVLSTLGLALWVTSLSTGAASDVWEGFKEAAKGSSSYSLDKGDCFDMPGGFDDVVYDVDTVPCSEEHDGEVFATVPLSGEVYPGDDRVNEVAEDRCYDLQTAYAMDSWALPVDVDVYYLTPSSDSWEYGDREITCSFVDEDDGGRLTGSLRADESTLDGDQLAFLNAMNALDDVLYEEPEDYAEDDLDVNTEWAQDVSGALEEQATALRGHTWPSGAEDAVDALVKDMEAARKDWKKAAAATDVDTYYEYYDSGYDYVDGDTTVTAREALGLATEVPTYSEDSGGGDDSGGSSGSSDGLDV